jgi:hypothetical protein
VSALTLAPSLFDQLGGEPTLEDVLVGAWEGLAAQRSVQCPVCQGEMTPDWAAGAGLVGGRCRDCGSTLG